MRKYYEDLAATCLTNILYWRKRSIGVAWLRFFSVIIVISGVVLRAQFQKNMGYAIIVLGIVCFLFLVKYHENIRKKQTDQEALKQVAEQYLDRFAGLWHHFEDTGSRYLTVDFPQGKDLDLLGKNSLYQYICTANTFYGQAALAAKLKNNSPQKEQIELQQEAVAELQQNKDFSLKLQSLGKSIPTQAEIQAQLQAFFHAAKQPQRSSLGSVIFMWACPFLACLLIAFTVIGFYRQQCLLAVLILAAGQLLAAFWANGKNRTLVQPLYALKKSIGAYREIFQLIEGERFSSQKLNELQNELRQNNGAIKALKALENIATAVDVRYNGIAYLLCNGLLLWDFHCVDAFRNWSRSYGIHMEKWLETVGELEALISFTVLCDVKETYTFPQIIRSSQPQISLTKIKHPLLGEEKTVANDFCSEDGICIITGSNMSGKTTFLRSVGMNLVLAYAGAPVMAEQFSASECAIFTSMRVEDSVSEGISTFYAELLRIKQMIEYGKKSLPMIALIDEIYKGTNSQDRIVGAKATLKRLAKPHCLAIVTTHDFELCDLEKEEAMKAVNYHFTEQFVGDEIRFDYLIREGRCQTTNAQHLLRLVGILDDL